MKPVRKTLFFLSLILVASVALLAGQTTFKPFEGGQNLITGDFSEISTKAQSGNKSDGSFRNDSRVQENISGSEPENSSNKSHGGKSSGRNSSSSGIVINTTDYRESSGSSGETAEELYRDIRNGSKGPEKLYGNSSSLLLIYRGPEKLNLVAVHGLGNSSTGSAEWLLKGLKGGEWAVKQGVTGFESDQNYQKISWSWNNTTSGGVYTGLERSFSISIQPDFNRVENWSMVSGSLENPGFTPLDTEKKLIVEAG